ncbi:MAG: hypothetical protein ACTHMC_22175 [Pseudobacter sp.]|uniref:hypothetical protein n=1 Tax=Pseudobacter sp. TaxID=2045420 RepID=UPI003F7E0858
MKKQLLTICILCLLMCKVMYTGSSFSIIINTEIKGLDVFYTFDDTSVHAATTTDPITV